MSVLFYPTDLMLKPSRQSRISFFLIGEHVGLKNRLCYKLGLPTEIYWAEHIEVDTHLRAIYDAICCAYMVQ